MKERPIIFSGPMVRAILRGTKTQTRRVVKHINPHTTRVVEKDANKYICHTAADRRQAANIVGRHFEARGPVCLDRPDPKECGYHTLDCPYGAPGDRLWVRETWQAITDWHHGHTIVEKPQPGCDLRYRATDEIGWVPPMVWRSPMFMPRWASRITLEVVAVRVERLQDISEDDALAEGIDRQGPIGNIAEQMAMGPDRYQFASLWQSINGPESWNANPWVWVVEFKLVTIT